MNKKILFKFERETKNTYRFKEKPSDGELPIMRSVYVVKSFFCDIPPKEIEIELSFDPRAGV